MNFLWTSLGRASTFALAQLRCYSGQSFPVGGWVGGFGESAPEHEREEASTCEGGALLEGGCDSTGQIQGDSMAVLVGDVLK